jgi:uncharacterized membrane protein
VPSLEGKDLKMAVSAPVLGLGLAMMGLGVFLVLLSAWPRNERAVIERRSVGVIFIGPIPIVLGGGRKWIFTAILGASIVAMLLAVALIGPGGS